MMIGSHFFQLLGKTILLFPGNYLFPEKSYDFWADLEWITIGYG
jgi:hypothetical protein